MPTKSKSRTTAKRPAKGTARSALRVERLLPRLVPPTHPGEMLLEEFLKPLAISQSAFAIRLGVSFPHLNEIVRGKRSVTPDTALRLARVTGVSAVDLDRCRWRPRTVRCARRAATVAAPSAPHSI
jgi:addiction module HigA family antidote